MNNVEKIRRYIEQTGAEFPKAYDLNMGELEALKELGKLEALALAFEYGRAKGARCVRKGTPDNTNVK